MTSHANNWDKQMWLPGTIITKSLSWGWAQSVCPSFFALFFYFSFLKGWKRDRCLYLESTTREIYGLLSMTCRFLIPYIFRVPLISETWFMNSESCFLFFEGRLVNTTCNTTKIYHSLNITLNWNISFSKKYIPLMSGHLKD